jgi:hypothetical protein
MSLSSIFLVKETIDNNTSFCNCVVNYSPLNEKNRFVLKDGKENCDDILKKINNDFNYLLIEVFEIR